MLYFLALLIIFEERKTHALTYCDPIFLRNTVAHLVQIRESCNEKALYSLFPKYQKIDKLV